MDETPDLLFARFRKTADPALLARVFDLTAPKLLRVAVHFAGEAGEAEDLLQATFLTAIERAGSFDPSRELLPWLLGILANHARAARRSGERAPDPERLLAKEAESPLEEAQKKEMSGALAEAIDALPEPYRLALTLRFRHGMDAGDIAHALGESPGAVRVRMHRGIEMLRKKLPASFVASLAALYSPGRGLEAVKEIVLAKAIGGAVVGNKLALAAVVLVLVAAIVGRMALWSGPRTEGSMPLAGPSMEALHAPLREATGIEAPAAVPSPESERAALASAPATPGVRGKVVDGGTGDPIAGARIEAYAPRRTRLADLERRWADDILIEPMGTIRTFDTWPWIRTSQLSDLQKSGAAEIEVADPPLPGSVPWASLASGADGSFELPSTGEAGFLVCTATGYETRRIAARPGGLVISMWPPKPIAGRLIDTQGKPLLERVKLRLVGYSGEQWVVGQEDRFYAGHRIVETDDEGRFTAACGAKSVQISSADPRWSVTTTGIHPEKHEHWVFNVRLAPGAEDGPAWIPVQRTPALVVLDSATGAPIERFSMNCREQGDDYPRWSGRFFAPGGRLRLVAEDRIQINASAEQLCQHLRFTVWAEGYAPQASSVDDLLASPDLEFRLERGELPLLEGFVRTSEGPASDLAVSLFSFGRLQWGEHDNSLVDSTATDARGRFAFRVPPGEWLLRCARGGSIRMEVVRVPASGPISIDLDRGGSIAVRVRGAEGGVRPNHFVVLRGSDGRQEAADTDEAGEARFVLLPAGSYRVIVPDRPERRSFVGGHAVEVELADGESRRVDVEIPGDRPRFPLLVLDPPGACAGWSARDASRELSEWRAVGDDSRIPIDVQFEVLQIELRGPDSRTWIASIPHDAADGYAIRVALGGPGFAGVLRDRSTGRPLAGVRVLACPVGFECAYVPRASGVTDVDGAFRLTGLSQERFEMRFPDQEGVTFDPSAGPADPPRPLTIELPRRETLGFAGIPSRRVTGHLLVGGAAQDGLSLSVASGFPSPDGTLWLKPRSAYARPGWDGRYEVLLPAAPIHRAEVFDTLNRTGFPAIEWDGSASTLEETRELDLTSSARTSPR